MEGLAKLCHVTSGENFMAHNELVSGQFPILNRNTNHDAINSLMSKITVKISVALRLRDCTLSDGLTRLSECHSVRRHARLAGGSYKGNQSL